MVSRAVATDFAKILTRPPALDFAMLVVGDDLKRLEKGVDQFEIDTMTWRATVLPKMQPAFDEIKRMFPAGAQTEPTVSGAITVVEDGMAAFSKPLHNDPAIAERIDQLSNMSTGAGKFVRKLMRRIEKIRVAQHAFFIDIYYGLLALRSELESPSEAAPSFDDPAKLGAFLRSQLA